MGIKFNYPPKLDEHMLRALHAISTKAVNGTITPLLVDYTNQRVGVKTTTPQYPLDVASDARIQGMLLMNSAFVLGMLSARNLDVPGAGSFNILSALQAYLNSVDILGSLTVGRLLVWNRARTRRYELIVDNDGALSVDPIE